MKSLALVAAVVLVFCGTVCADVVMDQIGTDPADMFGGHPSQDFEAANDIYDCATIDDFQVNAAQLNITQVEAVFLGSNGFQSYDNVTGWRVEIYSSASAASSSLVGDVASASLLPSAVTLLVPYQPTGGTTALVTLPVDINLPTAGWYWVGVIGVIDFETGGQLYVSDSSFAGTPGNSNSFLANPGGGFGSQAWDSNSACRVTTGTDDEDGAVPEPAGIVVMAISALAFRRRR